MLDCEPVHRGCGLVEMTTVGEGVFDSRKLGLDCANLPWFMGGYCSSGGELWPSDELMNDETEAAARLFESIGGPEEFEGASEVRLCPLLQWLRNSLSAYVGGGFLGTPAFRPVLSIMTLGTSPPLPHTIPIAWVNSCPARFKLVRLSKRCGDS